MYITRDLERAVAEAIHGGKVVILFRMRDGSAFRVRTTSSS